MALQKPNQITVPFASSGVKNTIPETATGSNLASMQEGFPTVTMTDVDQGGMPPQGQDMNGILFDVTTAIRYQQAGGLFPYDATFASKIDGYPIGALLTSADGTKIFQNMIDGNQSDPENGGQNWNEILTSTAIAGKQDALSTAQMNAVNSGITAAKVAQYDGYATGKQDTLTFDNTPTEGSLNPVTSDGIATSLSLKQDNITVDAVPTSDSTNPVQSGGVYDALAEKVDIDNAGDAEVIATGSTESRTLADRFADCVNVKDYGAVGNNIADDTAAIQAAIDTGKDVYFPCINNEQYKVTSTLETYREGQSFFSDPQANTGILFYTTGTDTPLFNVNHQLVRFTNLHIRSNTNGTGIGIYASAPDVVPGKPFVNNTDLTVHECDISNFYVGIDTNGRGPKVYGTVFGEVHDPIKINWTDESTAEATASDTDKILYGNDYGFRGTVINDNVFHVCHGVCINFVSGNPNGAIISGNRFDVGVGRFLVCAGKLQGATITNNALMYSGTTFIESPQIERCSIVGNTFRGTTVQSSGAADRYPTRFILSNTSSKYNTISGNTFECSQLDSVYLQNSYYDTITGNSFLNCAGGSTSSSFQGAIFLRTTAEGTVIDGNTCVLPNEYALFVHVNTSTTLKNVKITDNAVSDESRLLYTPNFSDLGGNEIGNSGLLVTATGSTTARTLANRFADVINVKDFGAKGDGVTDDRTAINSALAYASQNCKAVLFDGSFLATSGMIEIPSDTHIIGLNGARIIRGYNTADGHAALAALFPKSGEATIHDITIEGIVFDGNGDEFGNVSFNTLGWSGYPASNIVIRDCEFRDIIDFHAIDVDWTDGLLIDNCRFKGWKRVYQTDTPSTRREMIQIQGVLGNSYQCKNIIIQNCWFGKSETDGFGAPPAGIGNHGWFDSADVVKDITIKNCVFEGCSWYSISVYGWQNVLVEGNTFLNCRALGLQSRLGSDSADNDAIVKNVKFVHNTCRRDTVGSEAMNFWIPGGYASLMSRYTDISDTFPQNILIEGNTFDNYNASAVFVTGKNVRFTNNDVHQGAVNIFRTKNVEISGNTFINSYVWNTATSSYVPAASYPETDDCKKNYIIRNNIFEEFRQRSIYIGNTNDGVDVSGNVVFNQFQTGNNTIAPIEIVSGNKIASVRDNTCINLQPYRTAFISLVQDDTYTVYANRYIKQGVVKNPYLNTVIESYVPASLYQALEARVAALEA